MNSHASRKSFLVTLAAGLLLSGAAQAALHDRGGGLLYDDVLNVTWLQDANYAKTRGYDADGLMNWADANTWAANLVYHDSVRGVDWSDWRLARNSPVGSDWNHDLSFDGSTDLGYNITSPNSELAYMYYVNLGLKGYLSPTGVYQPDFGVFGNGTYNGVDWSTLGQNDVGLVKNLQSYAYWSGSAYAPYPASIAWGFGTYVGFQDVYSQYGPLYAWAVRPGDVAPVPEPETYALFLTGLGLMGAIARRRVGIRRAA